MNNKAFSIVELIIVIAVIGILAAILIPVFSKIIDKANEKSALSDAKNTLTNYVAYCESNQRSRQDLCIIVEKAKSYYAFIYEASTGELNNSKYNPLTADSLEAAADMLFEANVLVGNNENSMEIPLVIPEQLENVVIYEGYAIQAGNQIISLNKKQIGISLDESYTLTANVFPQKKVLSLTWESKDNNIATVRDGVVTPVSYGETEVVAHYGEVTATCKVIVDEFIEFSGSMAELKALIEDETDNALLLRLMVNVEETDNPALFPIVIPEDKIVRIDFNKTELRYSFTSDDYGIPAFIENNGGDFYMFCPGDPEDDYGYISIEDERIYETYVVESESVGHVLINKNGGFINVGNAMSVALYKKNELSYTVYNIDGFIELDKGDCFNSYGTSLVNSKDGIIKIKDIYFYSPDVAILNYGVIESIEGSLIRGDTIAIENYGLIKTISDGMILSTGGNAIENIGKKAIIKEISGGIIFSSGNNELEMLQKNALVMKDGSTIGAITGGEFKGKEAIVCDESSTIIYGISGGEFRTQVPVRLLAPGKTCIYNEETDMYIVE
ncbi:MAG: prepilin-type N-terminal cleavage/methylation domain-containing protein [Clostridiales bacterium]|nr:prepilin-type N-terminal cleavage/methylation domain-containing protein [Clostridiales bacterium]